MPSRTKVSIIHNIITNCVPYSPSVTGVIAERHVGTTERADTLGGLLVVFKIRLRKYKWSGAVLLKKGKWFLNFVCLIHNILERRSHGCNPTMKDLSDNPARRTNATALPAEPCSEKLNFTNGGFPSQR